MKKYIRDALDLRHHGAHVTIYLELQVVFFIQYYEKKLRMFRVCRILAVMSK